MTDPRPNATLHLSESTFRALAHQMADIAADFLKDLEALPSYPADPDTALAKLAHGTPEAGLGIRALDALREIIAACRAPTPRFFGYVLGSGEPVAALGDLLASVLNQNVTAWRSSPAAVSIEQQVVKWLAEFVGCGDYTGSLCGGGSSANLMGLAMARESRFPANETGVTGGIVYASSEVHMSIGKAVALLGLGRRNLRLIPVDAGHQMNLGALHEAIAGDLSAGGKPLAVVASAGTVNTGAIDSLARVRAICDQYGLWMHVDGAYGALAAAAAPEKFGGLNRADSISLDAHKWLYQPVDCGLLLYRQPAAATRAFSHSGDYARSLETDPVRAFSFFDQSLELSRRFRALKLWLSLRYHGLEAFRSAIRADLRHATSLDTLVSNRPELELLAPATLSAVCFRHRAPASQDVDSFNAAVLQRVISRGRVYLSNATIRGGFALRACFVNHRTRDADVALIVSEVLAAAKEVAAVSPESRT